MGMPAARRVPPKRPAILAIGCSTGGPKGVLVEHRNVVNFLTGMAAVVTRDSDACWLAVTSISFDISVLELFGALANGFTVVVHDRFGDGAATDD